MAQMPIWRRQPASPGAAAKLNGGLGDEAMVAHSYKLVQ